MSIKTSARPYLILRVQKCVLMCHEGEYIPVYCSRRPTQYLFYKREPLAFQANTDLVRDMLTSSVDEEAVFGWGVWRVTGYLAEPDFKNMRALAVEAYIRKLFTQTRWDKVPHVFAPNTASAYKLSDITFSSLNIHEFSGG